MIYTSSTKVVQNIFRTAFSLFHVLCLVCLFTSCNDEPTSLGSSFIQDTLTVYPLTSDKDSIILNQETRFIRSRTNGTPLFSNTGVMFVGQHENTNSKTWAVFTDIPVTYDDPNTTSDDSRVEELPTFGDTASYSILSATLVLQPTRYTIGDSTENLLSFSVREVTAEWFHGEDSLESIQALEAAGAYSTEVASFEGSIPLQDTMEVIRLPFDTNTVKKWLYQYSQPLEVRRDVRGIAFIPNENSTVIRQFSNNSTSPIQLEIVYQFADSTNPDTISFGNNGFTPNTGIYSEAPEGDTNNLTIQSGVSMYSQLNFDVSSIPRFASLHKVEIILTERAGLSKYGNFQTEPLRIAMALDDFTISGLGQSILARSQDLDTSKFIGSMISFVDIWNRNVLVTPDTTEKAQRVQKRPSRLKFQNTNIIIRPSDITEISRLDRTVFWGINAPNPDDRPYLEIVYSTRPIALDTL